MRPPVKHLRHLLVALTGLAVLAALAACSSSNEASPTPAGTGASGSPGAPTNMAPDAQQILKWNVGAEPNSVDPAAVAYTYELSVVNNAFTRLFDQDPKTSQLTPLAAAEVPTAANGGISADGLTYTIKLKSGLMWSDGTPLTASDFVYGIIRGFNLNISGAAYGGFITQIKGADAALKLDTKSATYVQDINAALKDSVVAVGPTTLKIVLAAPSNEFASTLFLPLTAAVKQSNVEALGDKYGTAAGAADMVTSGPFKYKEWVAKDHITLVRNDNYTIGHKAYLSQVEVHFIEDTTQAYNAFQSGQLDEAQVPPDVYPSVKSDPKIKQEEEFGTRWISVDVTIPPWNNKDFVIGISQATDREALARDVYKGIRKGWASICHEAVLACDPTIFSNLEYNLTNAKASIQKAYPNGNIPAVTLETVNDPTTKALVTTLQSQWQAVGVTTNIKTTDQKTLRADMKNHVAGTQITGWGMDFADPTDLWSIFTTAQVGANNLGFYQRPAYDTLQDQQDKAADPATRRQLLTQVQTFVAADPPVLQLFIQLRTNMFNPKVQGLVASPFDYQVYGDQFLSEVYISQ